LPHLQEYVSLRPDDAIAHFRLGSCLLRIAAVPRAVPAKLEPVELLSAQRNAESAAVAFARCAELSPGDEDASLSVATAHWRAAELAKERHDEKEHAAHVEAAQARLRATAERFPASPEPWFRLGVIAEAGGADDDARVAYQRALELDREHVPTMLDLAALLDRRGEAQAATTMLRQVIALDEAKPCLTPRERKRVRERAGAGART
jgi:tetratricopeptide (TPR) repeat protein